jgi:hypothetical protein
VTLPTSGFWVLNIAPLPAEAEPEPAPEPGLPQQDMEAESPAPAAPSWWQRLRALPRRVGVGREGARGDGGAANANINGQVSGISTRSPAEAGGQASGVSTPSAATADADGGPDGEAGVSPDGAGAGDAAPCPVGVLISADRYDLSDLAES